MYFDNFNKQFNLFLQAKYEILDNNLFLVDEVTGIVQTNRTYGRFGDGYFMLHVAAFNSERPGANERAIVGDTAKVKIYVLQVMPCRNQILYCSIDQHLRVRIGCFSTF